MNSGFSSILLEENKSEVDKDIASKEEQITSDNEGEVTSKNKGQATSENKGNKAPKETIIKCGKCMIVSQTFPDRKKLYNLPIFPYRQLSVLLYNHNETSVFNWL